MVTVESLDLERVTKFSNRVQFTLGVGGETVYRDRHRHAELFQVTDMSTEIVAAPDDGLDVFTGELILGHAAMHFQRSRGRHQHHRVGTQARFAALDIEKFLGAEIGSKTGFGDDVVGQLERGFGGDHRVAAVRDIGERAAVDEGGVIFQRLHQVRHEGILQQYRHRARRVDVARQHRLLVARVADHDVADTATQVVEVGGETEDCHDFRGHGDVEAALARGAVAGSAEADGDIAQGAVVHVHDALPGNAARIDTRLVFPLHVVIDQRRQQVVCGSDGVEVAGEVQVDIFHRHHLGIAATGCPALHAETGSEAGLAQAHDGLLADAVETVAQPDRGRGLALARRRR